ncbi:MAG: TetR/AcrR family transcriptional regulator [Alphaproteobacteria bacterium]|nr:TetR/AcrR family transcriptional regulator [Alphaproteobacteria bacterium]
MSGALKLRQRRSRQRREKIVAAATRLFGRQGIGQTSLTDVARLAGIPLPSLYDYFKDKQDLVGAVPEENYLALYRRVTQDATAGERSARTLLRSIYLANFEYIRANPDWGRLFFLEIWPSAAVGSSRAGQARIRKSVDRYALRYVELVGAAIEAGDYRKDLDPYLAMSSLMGGMCQLTAVWLLYRQPYDLVQRGAEMFDLLERAFVRERAARRTATRKARR